jgi:hypothetical protein
MIQYRTTNQYIRKRLKSGDWTNIDPIPPSDNDDSFFVWKVIAVHFQEFGDGISATILWKYKLTS